jgi:hypothetical protein
MDDSLKTNPLLSYHPLGKGFCIFIDKIKNTHVRTKTLLRISRNL